MGSQTSKPTPSSSQHSRHPPTLLLPTTSTTQTSRVIYNAEDAVPQSASYTQVFFANLQPQMGQILHDSHSITDQDKDSLDPKDMLPRPKLGAANGHVLFENQVDCMHCGGEFGHISCKNCGKKSQEEDTEGFYMLGEVGESGGWTWSNGMCGLGKGDRGGGGGGGH